MEEKAQTIILVVEDDQVLQDLYRERFEESGLKVLQAYDGLEALHIVDEHPEITLILLDLMLPRLSGYDVLARLKHDRAHSSIPVIIVSALADIDEQAKGLQLGATDYITKGEMLPGAIVEKIKMYALPVSGSTSA